MDPAKLKVVELRAELGKRGLDTKGNKAVLVERLRLALEENPEDPIVEKTENESNSSEEETGRSSRRAKEKTPEPSKLAPRTPSRTTRNAAATSVVTPKTPTRSMRASAVTARQSSLKSLKEESSEDEEEPPTKQQKLDTKPVVNNPEVPEKVQKQDEVPPKAQQAVNPVSHPVSPVKNVEKSPIKPQESPMKPQPSPTKLPDTSEQVHQSPTKVEQNPVNIESQIKSQTISEEESSQNFAKTESPTKSQIVQSPVKQTVQISVKPSTVQSPVKEQTVQSPVKQQTVQSPVKQQTVQSPVKQQTVQSPVKQQTVQSPTKLPIVQSPVKQSTVQSPVKTPSKEPEKIVIETEKSPKGVLQESPSKAPIMSKPVEVQKSTTKDEEKIPKSGDGKQETCSPIKKTDNNSTIMAEKEEVEDSAPKALNDKSDSTKDKQDVDIKEAKELTDSKSQNTAQNDRKRKRSQSPQEDITSRQKPDDEPEINDENVLLSWYDSDLNLQIDRNNFISATPLHKDGFGLVWAGARASYGFNKGKVYYESKIVEKCPIDIHDEISPHILRVGWSVSGTSMQLGEERLSYAYDSTGKKTTECNFVDYGVEFDVGDIVTSYLDMSDEKVVKIRYAVNDKDLGEAFIVNKEDLANKALFPHVLSKNCTFSCNFGQEEHWNKNILDDYTPVGKVELKDRIAGPKRPITKEECEMIMMCGLPGSGKTFWCSKYASEHPEKMYNILGTNSIIEKMKVMGLPLKDNYQGRWETVLSMCTRALNTLLDKAYTRRRNYILDHHNVYPSAQKRKMRNFAGFLRRAVVIVPKDEDFKTRRIQREKAEGKEVPDSTFLEMKASFAAPDAGEFISSVEWPELDEQEAKKLIEQYNKEGKAAGYGQQSSHLKRSRMDSKDNRDNRLYNNRDNRRGGGYQDRRNSGWRGGSNNGGWRDNRPAGRGHMRHGNFSGGPGGWRPRGPPPLVHRSGADRRGGSGGDRRPGNDRLRPSAPRQGSWGGASSYQGQQSNWNQRSWPDSQSQGWNHSGWAGGNNQQWNWQKYGHGGNYGSNYNQSYDNGNYGGWNQQYYNQYWDQPQQSGQMVAGSQAVSKQ